MSNLLLNKAFSEHSVEDVSSIDSLCSLTLLFKQKTDCKCVEIIENKEVKSINLSYYIGTDWLVKEKVAIYVAPKLNDEVTYIDYLKMAYSCLRHSDISNYVDDLFEVKFNEPLIEINSNQDLLTPLLVVQFLQLVKIIVRKGLKKSYYNVEQNLNSKIKGKLLVSPTIKQNIIKNKPSKAFCKYDEFGFNCFENRVLKRTLLFIQKYLVFFPEYSKLANPIINYCMPAFHNVDENVDIKSIKNVTHNSFYKEYKEALYLSNLILKRFGYNIKDIEYLKKQKIKIPPFWIDMSKLFELYVLGLLKDKYKNKILFQVQGTYGQPDFLLVNETERIIIDTKYKRKYQQEKYIPEDIRQLSGYSRDIKILKRLGFISEDEQNITVDCLIIYPDQTASEDLADNLKSDKINGFSKFYKMPIKMPIISN